MDVIGMNGLETVIDALDREARATKELRNDLGLAPFEGTIVATWTDSEADLNELVVPVLRHGYPSSSRTALHAYFSAMQGLVRTVGDASRPISECEAYAIIAGVGPSIDEVSDSPMKRFYAHRANEALGSYDPLEALETLNIAMMSEAFVHDRTPYHTLFSKELDEYRCMKAAWNSAGAEILVEHVIDLGIEWQKREIIKGMRTAIVEAKSGSTHNQMFEAYSLEPARFLMQQIASIIDLPFTEQDEEPWFAIDETYAAQAEPLYSASDQLGQVRQRFLTHVHGIVPHAVEQQPERIRSADEHAQSADAWLDAVR